MKEAEFVSTKEAAEMIGVARSTLHLWVKNGVLTAYRQGYGKGVLRFAVADVMRAKQGRRIEGCK